MARKYRNNPRASIAEPFDKGTFAACVSLLKAGLESLRGAPFGRQPEYTPEVFHYSKTVALFLGRYPRDKVLKIRDQLLAGGHLYDLRKPAELAELRCNVAERLLGEDGILDAADTQESQ